MPIACTVRLRPREINLEIWERWYLSVVVHDERGGRRCSGHVGVEVEGPTRLARLEAHLGLGVRVRG